MDTIELANSLSGELDGCTTVSDKIRLLDQRGIARADIARILGKRYQHVRNVLEADAKKRQHQQSAEAQTAATGVHRLIVSRDGTLRLPRGLMRGLGIAEGGTLAARLEESELRLVEPLTALRKVQDMLAPLRQKLGQQGVSVVDELIAERRAEAAQEDEV